jgi:acetyl-CoA synthetase
LNATWSRRGDKTAYIWARRRRSRKTLSLPELYAQVNRVANGLKSLGVHKGDRVVIYMPLTVEGVTAMLACAASARSQRRLRRVRRRGAAHAYRGRRRQGGDHRRRELPARQDHRPARDHGAGRRAPEERRARRRFSPRGGHAAGVPRGRWEALLEQPDECPAEIVDAEHPLYILYTSGTTANPRCLHVHGGYMVGTHLHLKTFTTWVRPTSSGT